MTDDIFKDMREQMRPDEDLITRLHKTIETESTGPSMDDTGINDEASGLFAQVLDTEKTVFEPEAIPDTVHTPKTSDPTLTGQGTPHKDSRPVRRSRGFYLSIAAATCAVLIGGGVLISVLLSSGGGISEIFKTQTGAQSSSIVELSPVRAPADYYEVYEALDEANALHGWSYSSGSGGVARSAGDVLMPTPAPDTAIPSVAPQGSTSAYESPYDTSSGYSETNVQVEGIDEGDIVKTDGVNIYVLSGDLFVIYAADGADTRELSSVSVIYPDEDGYIFDTLRELYIDDSIAVIVISHNDYTLTRSYPYRDDSTTRVLCYDIRDPYSPELVEEFSQSGIFNSSRLNGDVLYILSTYVVHEDIEKDDPTTYIPLIGKDGVSELMPCEDVRIMPVIASANYTVLTSMDLNSLQRIDQKSILGSAETIYMSYDNLYIASTVTISEEKEPYKESVYTIEEHVDKQSTQLMRIALDQGSLLAEAQGMVDGVLLNQFSLDEYEGNLRLAVTIYNYSYRILRDEAYGITDIQYGDDSDQTNAVFVLDPSMTVIGSVEGLAKDEQIYSARFTGAVAYLVTFRQVDPLFTLDLSDPTNPQITSELKIPGFSTYLHPFGESRLLGLGYDTESNRTTGMKLSMFDTSNPFDVYELNMELVGIEYSEALYDHKAVLIDVDRNIIGFPGASYGYGNRYFIYAYDDDYGFVLKGVLELSDSEGDYYYYYGQTRGLYIDSNLYVVSGNAIDIFDLATLNKIQTLVINDA